MSETLVENILGLLPETDFSEELVLEVLRKLEIFGVEVFESDFYMVAFAIKSVELGVKNFCNIDTLSPKLYEAVTDRVCGEVLYTKNINNELPENLKVEEVVKSLSIGDTTVSYGSGTGNEVLQLIEALRSAGEGDLLCCRKISW